MTSAAPFKFSEIIYNVIGEEEATSLLEDVELPL
jgi:hypothetical protein